MKKPFYKKVSAKVNPDTAINNH